MNSQAGGFIARPVEWRVMRLEFEMRAEITEQARAAIEPKQEAPLDGLASLMLEMRKLAGMTQGDVAEIIGLGRTSVTNMEKGNQPATVENLERLAVHLGLEVVVTVREKAHNA